MNLDFRILSTLMFLVIKIRKKHPIYVSQKCYEDKHGDLLLIGKKGRKHYVVVKDFNTFMYHHTLDCRKKHYCYCYITIIVSKLSVQKNY